MLRLVTSEGGSLPRTIYAVDDTYHTGGPPHITDKDIAPDNDYYPNQPPLTPQPDNEADDDWQKNIAPNPYPEDYNSPRGDNPQGFAETILFNFCGIRPALSVVVAMDSFGGSLSSRGATNVAEAALKASRIERVYKLPISDGGGNFLDSFKAMYSETFQILRVSDIVDCGGSVLKEVPVLLEIDNGLAVLEASEACGTGASDPMKATSYGTGQMILKALEAGAQHIIIGVGHTSTLDGGAGLVTALGVRFYDEAGNELYADKGNIVSQVAGVDCSGLDPRVLGGCKITAAVNVQNALLGAEGAVNAFGLQKGLSNDSIPILDNQMQKYASIVEAATNSTGLAMRQGMGAGGGIAFALSAFLKAEVENGFQVILEQSNLQERIRKADLVITGEERFDASSMRTTNLTLEIARICKDNNRKCFLYATKADQEIIDMPTEGLSCIISLVDSRATPEDVEKAQHNLKELLYKELIRSMKLLRLGQEVRI